jgi:hypothetical protein
VKLGRNDVCPCGSGKKYKHCCLHKAALPDETLWARAGAASHRLNQEILRFGVREFGARILDAWEDFNLGLSNGPYDPKSAENTIFMPYFLFHWNPDVPTGKRVRVARTGIVAHAFALKNSSRLPEMERQFLEQSVAQPLSFYEVMSSQPGERIALRDILIGQETEVREGAASKSLKAGDIIFAQITPLTGITLMGSCAPLLIPPKMKADVIGLRKKLRRKAARQNREVSSEDLVRFEDDIREVYLNIRDYLHAPIRIANTDGEPLILNTITFEVESAQVAFDALAPLAKGVPKKQLLRNAEYDAAGMLRKVNFDWIKRGNRKFKTWDNTILGTIRLLDRTLIAEVNSEQRAARLRDEIKARLGAAAIYKSTVAKSYEQMERTKGPAPTDAEPSRAEEDKVLQDPEIRERARESLQREVEAWIHRKVPVLGGRTPVQAVKDPDGREIVESLLTEFERGADRGMPEAIRPDVSVLRRLLNLPQQKF